MGYESVSNSYTVLLLNLEKVRHDIVGILCHKRRSKTTSHSLN